MLDQGAAAAEGGGRAVAGRGAGDAVHLPEALALPLDVAVVVVSVFHCLCLGKGRMGRKQKVDVHPAHGTAEAGVFGELLALVVGTIVVL